MNREENIFKILSQYKKILEDRGYKVIYVGLYGSQNYNLDDALSDIDAKAIILPSLHDIIFRKVTSTTIECENGNIDVKDLITFYDVIKKGNFSYIESIDTEYSIGDKYIKELFKKFRPNLKSILGAMHEKRKALTHEYPSKTEEFEKWGFDPKQLHHILRLRDLLYEDTLNNKSYSYEKYYGEDIEEMIGYKRNTFNLTKEFAEKLSGLTIDEAKELIPKDYVYAPVNIDDEINAYIEIKLKIDLYKIEEIASAREVRTFNNPIPRSDLEKFPILEQYKGKDISYIVYESIDIL